MTAQSELPLSAETPVLSPDDQRERSAYRRQQIFFWAPLGVLGLIAVICFLGPIALPIHSPIGGSITNANLAVFSPGHLLGTDPAGNDNLAKVLYGGRVSLEVGFATVGIGLLVGGGLGALAGFRSGWADLVISRLFDALLSFPALVLAIVIATYLGPSELHVIYAISFFSIPAVGRLARANTLRIRSATFFAASRISGTHEWAILRRHVAPNILPNLLTFSFLSVSVSIIAEAALSFLGLGVPPPNPSWGNMLALGEQYLDLRPVLLFIPAVAIFLTILALNLAGDALRARWAE
jgi:peptide/nickel transport system permease protein